ncbi:hypothetical protein ACS0TY_033242 [Phlomoides rotata]
MPKKDTGGKFSVETYTFNEEIVRKDLASMIVLYEYPLSMVEHFGFRRFLSSLQPLFKVVSRNTVKNDIMKIYEFEKTKTMRIIEKNTSKIAIITDMWTTSNQKKGFIYVSCPHTAEVLCDVLVDCLMDWFIDPSEVGASYQSLASSLPSPDETDHMSKYDKFVASDFEGNVKNEFDSYLDECVLQRLPDFDILSWWKNELKYPTLQLIVRDVLAIPISTVASESAFSTGGRFISPHRSRLHHDTLEALMFSQDWLWTEAKEIDATPSECYTTFHDDVDDETNEDILGTDRYHEEL